MIIISEKFRMEESNRWRGSSAEGSDGARGAACASRVMGVEFSDDYGEIVLVSTWPTLYMSCTRYTTDRCAREASSMVNRDDCH